LIFRENAAEIGNREQEHLPEGTQNELSSPPTGKSKPLTQKTIWQTVLSVVISQPPKFFFLHVGRVYCCEAAGSDTCFLSTSYGLA